MKLKWWILIIIGAMLVIEGTILTLILTLDISWWWLGGTGIFWAVAGIIAWLIYWFKFRKRPKPPRIKIPMAKGEQLLKNKVRLDEDNPDELVIERSQTITEGQPGTEKTNVLYISGNTYWGGDEIVGLLDLDDSERSVILRNPSEKEVKEALRKFALNPEIQETEEEVVLSRESGEPIKKIVKKKQTPAQLKEKKEIEEAEEKEGL